MLNLGNDGCAAAREHGVALITALLVVAIATLAATALLSSANLSLHRTAALRDSEQAWWVSRGVEAWVLGILEKDASETSYDGLDEVWAQPVANLPIDQGFLRGELVDQHGRFNLNNLANPHPQKAKAYEDQFTRLLGSFAKITPPPGLVAAIKDWIDSDQNPGFPAGAEDTAYLALDPPYRTANQPFTVVSELLAIQGVTPELYAALRPFVAALPETGTLVNVNTAPAEVLRALSASVDEMKLQSFIEVRKDKPKENVNDFNAEGILGADAAPYLTVESRYFQIQGEVFVGSSRVALYSLIHRPRPGKPAVLAHAAEAE